MLFTLWFIASNLLINYIMTREFDPDAMSLNLTYGVGMLYLFESFHEASSFWPVSPFEVFGQFIGMLAIYEVWFYHMHRLMHTKHLKRFHAVHHNHEMSAKSALVCHPIEYVFGFTGPALVAPYLMTTSWFVTWVWLCLGTVKVARAHDPGKTNHELHHKYGNVNYGTLDVLDWLYGTYKNQ